MNRGKWYLFLFVGIALLLAGAISACGTAPTSAPATNKTQQNKQPPSNVSAISWNEAKDHVGELATVSGAVVGAYCEPGDCKCRPCYLYVGKPQSEPDRLTVIIRGPSRYRFTDFPDVHYLEKTIFVTGQIIENGGTIEIEVAYPSQIQEQ